MKEEYKEILQTHKFNRIKYNIMWHSNIKTNEVWQKQDHKHQIFQHLHPLQLSQIPHNKNNTLHNPHNKHNK